MYNYTGDLWKLKIVYKSSWRFLDEREKAFKD